MSYFLHIDADSFFASIIQASNPNLKGIPVVAGAERGVVTAMSSEAKQLGVPRGISVHKLRQQFPQVVFTHADFETYSLYSRRIKNIMMFHFNIVDKTSIDECYTKSNYSLRNTIINAKKAQKDLSDSLGLSFSIGIGPTKTLAKIASGVHKPAGLTVISNNVRHVLKNLDISTLPGVGRAMLPKMQLLGLKTALDFADQTPEWVAEHFSKPTIQLHKEINGVVVHRINAEQDPQQSFSRIRSFSWTDDKTFLLTELSRNAEVVCRKARRAGLRGQYLWFGLKIPKRGMVYEEIKLPMTTNNPTVLIAHIQQRFDRLYQSGAQYKATLVGLGRVSQNLGQIDLFGHYKTAEDADAVWCVADQLNRRYGSGTVSLASSKHQHKVDRNSSTYNSGVWWISQRCLYLPYLGETC